MKNLCINVSLLLFWVLFSGQAAISAFQSAAKAGEQTGEPDQAARSLELRQHEHLVAIKQSGDSSLAPFTTDGCSGGLSVGWRYLSGAIDHVSEVHGATPPWESCCVEHDRVYHSAGPIEMSALQSYVARKEADSALRQCVLETGAQRSPELSAVYGVSEEHVRALYRGVAELMYRAVRLGGVPCSGLPWRWGYGWKQCE